MLLHPPSLAWEFTASFGELSRRSGSAAEADNHSDISPSLESTTCERLRTDYRTRRYDAGVEFDAVVFSALAPTDAKHRDQLCKTLICSESSPFAQVVRLA